MSDRANQYIDRVILKEKGYVFHKDDKGGETNWGITLEVARTHGYLGNMATMPIHIAREIYLKEYWLAPKFDLIDHISPKVAEELFDSGVNCGVRTSSKWLQRCLNALNKSQTLYTDLTVDGLIGDNTVEALKQLLIKRSLHGETVLLKALNCVQGEYYITISENREANESFLFGWLRKRVEL